MNGVYLIKCIVPLIPLIHQCGFRKGHRTKHKLLMVEKLKKSFGNSGVRGMLLTDLSKEFDTV